MQRSLSSLAETVMDLGPGPRISSSWKKGEGSMCNS
jgi:hypothetical protein